MKNNSKKNVYNIYYYTQGDPSKEAIVFIHPAYGDNTCFHPPVGCFCRELPHYYPGYARTWQITGQERERRHRRNR